MDPQGGGPLLHASSDWVRIAQATGMLMAIYGLDERQAVALLYAVSWTRLLDASSVARVLVEEWPLGAEGPGRSGFL